MSRDELSFKLSCDIAKIVSRQYFVYRYGIKACDTSMEEGDLYDLYITKSYVDSMFDCDDIFKTDV